MMDVVLGASRLCNAQTFLSSFFFCLLACLFISLFLFFHTFSQDSPRGGGGVVKIYGKEKANAETKNNKHSFHYPRRSTVRKVC